VKVKLESENEIDVCLREGDFGAYAYVPSKPNVNGRMTEANGIE
jgi:hypothetical protein